MSQAAAYAPTPNAALQRAAEEIRAATEALLRARRYVEAVQVDYDDPRLQRASDGIGWALAELGGSEEDLDDVLLEGPV